MFLLDPMSESCEPKVLIPCNGNWNSLLKNLYVDLFDLIVESRIPGINDRGYGDGIHCPPLLGPNVHICDITNAECQKHQRLIYHLLRAVRHKVFEIEVLMLPDCCSESKLSERIQSKEYVLLERWSLKCMHGCKSQTAIEVSELLRAVRSFLHFSQISAWLSLTKGKSPSNIYYWVKPTTDPSSTQFESNPEVHYFPICKISDDLCGLVKVNYPTRKQYVPIIPCSKHPPHCDLTFRAIRDDPNLTQNIPLNSQIVKQLQKTCDNQQTIITVKHCTSDSESVLKTVTHNVDVNKANRILKHSKSQMLCQNSLPSITKNTSQENVCFSKKSCCSRLSRKEPALNLINNVLLPSMCELSSSSMEITRKFLPEHNITKCLDPSAKLPGSELCILSSAPSLLLQSVETSETISNALYSQSLLNTQPKSLKRKQTNEHDMHIIPRKKKQSMIQFKDELIKNYPNAFVQSSSSPENSQKKHRRRKHCYSPISLKKTAKLVSNRIRISSDALNLKTEISTNCETEIPSSLIKNTEPQEIKTNRNEKSVQKMLNDNERNISSLFHYCDSKNCTNNLLHQDIHKLYSNESNIEHLPKEADKISKCYKCSHIFKKYTKSLSPQLKQFKLKKRFSKTFYKSQISSHLNSSEIFNSNEIFPLHFSNENKNIDTNSSLINTNLFISDIKSNKCLQKFTKHVTSNHSLKNECIKSSPQIKNRSANKLECPSNKSTGDVDISKIFKIKDQLLNKCNIVDFCNTNLNSLDYNNFDNLESNMTSFEHLSKVNSIKKTLKFSTKTALNCISPTKICTSSDHIPNEEFNTYEPLASSTSMNIHNSKENSPKRKCQTLNISSDLHQKATPYLDCFPRHKLKFARGRKLLGNFEESILKGCLLPVRNVKGFHVEIGASGSFCPNHITLPANVSFYELDNPQSGATPYMAHVSLCDIEYCLPKRGAVQVTLFNPSETVVKMFVLNYDLSDMPPMCHTFIRQKLYFMPIGSTEECPTSQNWLRFIVHLRFASSKSGKMYLHEDLKIVVLNKSNDDAASEFSQEPHELRSFIHVPMNPKFSTI